MKCTYEEGEKLAKTHVCGEPDCGREMVVAWINDGYEVYCRDHPFSARFKPIHRLEDHIPDDTPGKFDAEIAQAGRRREAAKNGKLTIEHQGTVVSDLKDVGTGHLATANQVRLLVEFCNRTGLDLYRRHACLMYGKPYIEIDGLYFLARETKEFEGLSSRPVTLSEKAEFGWDPYDVAWFAYVYRKGCAQPFRGCEHNTQARINERTRDGSESRWPVLRDRPDRMTEKQAIRYAMRAAFPDLPVWENEDSVES